MKIQFDKKYVQIGIIALIIVLSGILFTYLLFHGASVNAMLNVFFDIMTPIFIGLVLAYILNPIMGYIEKHIFFRIFEKINIKFGEKGKKRVRVISLLITIILVAFIVYALIAMLVRQVIPSINNIIKNYHEYINNFIRWIQNISDSNPDISKIIVDYINKFSLEIEDWLQELVLPRTSDLIKSLSHGIIGGVRFLLDFIIGIIFSFYILCSKEIFTAQAKKIIYSLFKSETANTIITEIRFVNNTFIGFLSGKVLDSLIIGLLCFIGITLLNIPYAALISVIIGVTNLVPYFGPWVGAIPTTIFVLVVNISNPILALYFVIFILVLQQFDGNILGPKILGDSTGLSSFWVLFAIIVFGGLFGVIGMVIGVPVLAVIYDFVKRYINRKLVMKNLPTESAKYLTVGAINNNQFEEYVKPDNTNILSKPISLKSKKNKSNKAYSTDLNHTDYTKKNNDNKNKYYKNKHYNSKHDNYKHENYKHDSYKNDNGNGEDNSNTENNK